jgi:hypothetical protein
VSVQQVALCCVWDSWGVSVQQVALCCVCGTVGGVSVQLVDLFCEFENVWRGECAADGFGL